MEPEISLPCSQGPPLVHILSQVNPANTLSTYFPKVYSNVSSTLSSSQWSLPFEFSDRNFVRIFRLSHARYFIYV
jgi:hypothetical protein